MQRTVEQWVDYIQTLHHRQMDLTLDRVRTVFERLMPTPCPFKVITIAGTNGKGSTAELVSSLYRAGGYRTGKYTSPHLVRFNERIVVAGKPIDDVSLLEAFERVEILRGEISLTYFEFATVVALSYFVEQEVEVAVMEVGLGGRMDAVNVLDPDVAIITSLSLDHTQWLGETLEEIAYEKAGIARSSKPCLVGLASPPASLLKHMVDIGADLKLLGRDFSAQLSDDRAHWNFVSDTQSLCQLPLPFGQHGVQLHNAALALQATQELSSDLPLSAASLIDGIANAALDARCQCVQRAPFVIIDVAHNEDSVARLDAYLGQLPVSGRVVAVCGMLKDKNIAASLSIIAPRVDYWFLASIHNERGAEAGYIESILTDKNLAQSVHCKIFDTVAEAYQNAFETLTADDCLLVFGSFHVAGDILRLRAEAYKQPDSERHVSESSPL